MSNEFEVLAQTILNNAASHDLGQRCAYCGVKLATRPEAKKCSEAQKRMKTADHIIPKSEGGRRTVRCCKRCNDSKGILSVEEFRFVVAFRAGAAAKCEFKFHAEEIITGIEFSKYNRRFE